MTRKSVPGYEGFYEASDTGSIRSVDRIVENSHTGYKEGKKLFKSKVLKPNKSGNVALSKDGVVKFYKVSQLILLSHIGPPPSKQENLARHLDDNPTNNILDNLAWGSHKDNHDDGVRNNRHARKGTPEALKYGEKLRGLKRPGVNTGRKDREALIKEANNRQRGSDGRFL